MNEKRCPVAPEGKDLPWHVHDDWYAPVLSNMETVRDLLESALEETKSLLNDERVKNANLQDSVESLVMDLSLMETRINELTGVIPEGA